jgi:hypothetical protein
MELYDIGPYVNPGENRLLVHLESDVVLPKLAVSGLVELRRERLNFSTDGRWRLLHETRAHRVPAEQTSVMVMERVRESAPDANLTLDFKEIESPAGMNLVRVERYLGFALITFLAVALSLSVLHRISRHYDPIPLWQDLETLVLPLFLAGILMVCLLILEQELRFDALASFQLPLLALMAVVVLLWEGFILIERIDRRWWMDE